MKEIPLGMTLTREQEKELRSRSLAVARICVMDNSAEMDGQIIMFDSKFKVPYTQGVGNMVHFYVAKCGCEVCKAARRQEVFLLRCAQ